jgi:hypothetical protein
MVAGWNRASSTIAAATGIVFGRRNRGDLSGTWRISPAVPAAGEGTARAARPGTRRRRSPGRAVRRRGASPERGLCMAPGSPRRGVFLVTGRRLTERRWYTSHSIASTPSAIAITHGQTSRRTGSVGEMPPFASSAPGGASVIANAGRATGVMSDSAGDSSETANVCR